MIIITKKYSHVIVCGIDGAGAWFKDMNIRDLAAIVLYALGINAPALNESGWTSQIPSGIFEDLSIPEYRDFSHLTGAAPRISKVPHTSEAL